MEKRIFLLIVVLIFFSGCSTSFLGEYNFSPVNIKSDSELTVKAGDTVKINYILSTADKQVLDTSFEEVAKNWELNLTHAIEPMTVKVGDGMIIPGLEEDLLGMKVGEQKEVLIPPERGYGPRNESLVRTFPRTSVFPRVDVLTPEAFKTIFRTDPVVGGVYGLNYWNSTVTNINSNKVTIMNNARNTSLETQRGTVHIYVSDDSISVVLVPALGTVVQTIEGTGRVVSIGEEDYTVDLNHPLAGETVLFFVRVEEIIKPQPPEEEKVVLGDLEFLTSLERARNLSKENGRLIFLYAHAAWCGWCRKFEADVLTDEEVLTILNRDFINAAFDVDAQPGLARNFNIFGTPTIIFLERDGSEVMRVRGYRNAETFVDVLNSVKKKPLN